MNTLSHFDDQGQAHMVDVGSKPASCRTAVAGGYIEMQDATISLIEAGHAKKGDVLAIARIAAIMAAKQTSTLIPLCHPLLLTHISITFKAIEPAAPQRSAIYCQTRVETLGATGVEMEALTALQVALLTIYDMCKAVDRTMVISNCQLLEKHGGQSGSFVAGQQPPATA